MAARRVLLLLLNGVEIFEAGAFFDVLGWASEYGSEPIEVVVVGPTPEIRCSFGLRVTPDRLLGEVSAGDFDALAIPGGFVEYGFDDDAVSDPVAALIRSFGERGRPIAAICTGAIPVAASGVLQGRRATTYHLLGGHRRRQLARLGAEVLDQPVVRDEAVTTSTGPGTAVEVALVLLEQLTSRANADGIRHLMGFPVPDRKHDNGFEEDP